MPCECEVFDVRQARVGACLATIRVDSKCERIKRDGGGEGDGDEYFVGAIPEQQPRQGRQTAKRGEQRSALRAPARKAPPEYCTVTYAISNLPNSTASVTEFSAGDDVFQFPVPIAPGAADSASITRLAPADCSRQRTGKVKLSCAAGGGMTINRLEVCILS